ncbi:hypothetical protein [Methanobrevibacter filiformis]|uniref:Uncharacterized protein n=1 Tax=Methanobrevibacter filiformis TaxID=55758 RepID=A0A166F4Y6_9EURY|nr:hypothetical protein [Methanobrevibacter filiformis]KZX17319.1 hypothetical protein MBFIL_02320 [Methanobrevibacter filiformis]
MKFKIVMSFLIFLIGLTAMSAVSAHGVDVTEDNMIIVNETNAIETKKLVDSMDLDIKVYKFTANGDVEHILEHALENPNKKILAVAFQDTVTKYVEKHPTLSNRVTIIENSKADIKEGIINLNDSAKDSNGESMSIDYTTLVLVIVIIGMVAGIGVFVLKR